MVSLGFPAVFLVVNILGQAFSFSSVAFTSRQQQQQQQQHLPPRIRRDQCLFATPNSPVVSEPSSTSSTESSYTLEYARNFQRHVVRRVNTNNSSDDDDDDDANQTTCTVVESFLWFDQAIQKYPTATRVPVKWRLPALNGSLAVTTAATAAVQELSSAQNGELVPWMVAGGGRDDSDTTCTIPYPIDFVYMKNATSNVHAIESVIQGLLKWFPSQVNKLLDKVPDLQWACPQLLRERLEFLLAPLPTSHVTLQQVNKSAVDWPAEFYTKGHGAGMSLAQVSHALETVPALLLTPSTCIPGTTTTNRFATTTDSYTIRQLAAWYEQTPTVVFEMARNQLEPWLTGTCQQQTAATAYLHWKGWEWTQWRVVLTAFPAMFSPCTVSSWEMDAAAAGGSSSKRVPDRLRADVLQYLLCRLQVGPGAIHAMFKTHWPAMRYSLSRVRTSLNGLQSVLQLDSASVQAIVLLMPSLLGASVSGMEARKEFWIESVGLTLEQLQQVCKDKPAVLQYSMDENLQPKLDFFRDELEIPATAMVRFTCSHPQVWGRSLDRYLRPMVASFQEYVDLSSSEFGDMVVRAPELLACSFRNNLQVKLAFLRDRLGLEPDELKAMILATPRILMQSMEQSLQPKIDLLEKASVGGERESRAVLRKTPSLLLNSKAVLKGRLERALAVDTAENQTLSDLLDRSSSAKRARRKSKVVLLVTANDPAAVQLEFANVAEAATHAGISKSNMYSVVREERLLQGKKYIYGNATTMRAINAPVVLDADTAATSSAVNTTEAASDIDSPDGSNDVISLNMCIAGRAFPPEDLVRGRRRAGGLAFRVPTWTKNDWRKVAGLWTGQRILLSAGTTMIVAYPYTKPSRPRCSLYACREGLRAASEWLQFQDEPRTVDITVETDSNFVLDLLQNTTQVLEWGSATTIKDFNYTGPAPVHQVNRDILYPLARTLYHLVEQDLPAADGGVKVKHNVTVAVVHSNRDRSNRQVGNAALHAAQLTYDKIK